MMTFKYTHTNLSGRLVSQVEHIIYDSGDIHEVMQEFRRFLLAVSYHPDSISEYVEAE